MHRPDGVPDILQFIEHGVLNLVAQAEQIGHMASTLSNSILDNYHHLGDAASRALTGYNDELAARALKQSKRLMQEATELMNQRRGQRTDAQADADANWLTGTGDGNASASDNNANRRRQARARNSRSDLATNLQLYAATREQQYRVNFEQSIWEALDRNVANTMQTALDAVPYMDEAYKQKLRPYVEKYNAYVKGFDQQNPYGVPIGLGNWAGVNAVLNFGITINYAHIYFPDIVSKDEIYRVSNWLYGCHPYHNYSFVAVVGAARPKQVFYGNNRADFSFIPGNVAPGLLFRQPDHFENFDDWPFLWGQNEGTIAGNTQYIIFGSAFKNIVGKH